MNTRLQQFLSAENLTQAQFADSINVARASISHILAGRNNPGYDFIINTMKRYPDLNIEWLLIGKGKMYRTGRTDPPQQAGSGTDNAVIMDNAALMENQELDLGLFADMPDNRKEVRSLLSDNGQAVQESPVTVPDTDRQPDNGISQEMNPSGNLLQQPARQRKAKRIIIFYDDGTYQEF